MPERQRVSMRLRASCAGDLLWSKHDERRKQRMTKTAARLAQLACGLRKPGVAQSPGDDEHSCGLETVKQNPPATCHRCGHGNPSRARLRCRHAWNDLNSRRSMGQQVTILYVEK